LRWKEQPMKRVLQDYSFGWLMLAMFLFSIIAQFFSQMADFANQAQSHGEPFMWSQFWPNFLQATFENWQSEFLQLLFQAAGLKWLLFRGSSQSRDEGDRMEAKIDRLLEEQGIDPNSIEAHTPPFPVRDAQAFKSEDD
jgi:hypothetical protein